MVSQFLFATLGALSSPTLRNTKRAGILLRLAAFITDLSVCAWISTKALRGVALRLREQIMDSLGIHALGFAIDAGTVAPKELQQAFEERVYDLQVDLLDSCFIAFLAGIIVIGAVCFVYFSIFEARPFGATPGKLAIGLRIVNTTYALIPITRSVLRQTAKAVTISTGGLGFFLAIFSPRRRALHDQVAGTFVVRVPIRHLLWLRLASFAIWMSVAFLAGRDAYQRGLAAWHWFEVLRLAYPEAFSDVTEILDGTIALTRESALWQSPLQLSSYAPHEHVASGRTSVAGPCGKSTATQRRSTSSGAEGSK